LVFLANLLVSYTSCIESEYFLETYKTEGEQVEALKHWWDENGKLIIIGVVLGLLGIFGWRYWLDYNRQQAASASALYQMLAEEVAKNKDEEMVKELSTEIINEFCSTNYAVFTKLTLAKLAVDKNNLEGASIHLRWALENNKEENFTHIITLRLARVLEAMDNYDEALKILKVSKTGEFSASYNELRGDINMIQGNTDAARTNYKQALVKKQASRINTSILEMKLDDLGRTEVQ